MGEQYMKNKILLSITLISCSISATSEDTLTRSAQKEFILAHHVDKETTALLDTHSRTLSNLVTSIHSTPMQKNGVWQFEWLPGYYVKYNVERVLMRERLAHCIEKYSLNLLHTPEKFLYHIKGRPTQLHNLNYVVLIKEVQPDPAAQEEPMTLEQVEQFITLIEKTGHCSTFGCNYLRLSDRRISFIDTDGTFNKKNPIKGIIGLLNQPLETYYTSEALYYIVDKIAKHLAQLPHQDTIKSYRNIYQFFGNQSAELNKKLKKVLKKQVKNHKKQLNIQQ